MKNAIFSTVVISTCLALTNPAAAQCDKNFQEVSVQGAVTTQVISEQMQVGTIDLRLESIKTNKVLFDQRGAVVGRITAINPNVFPVEALLDHDITFDDGVALETTDDTAAIYGDPSSSWYVSVEETISNFSGTKNFRKATGEIKATGFLNVPKGDGLYNEFTLSGSLCIKD